MTLALFIGTLFLLLFTGIPIAFILIICAIVLSMSLGMFNPYNLAQQMLVGTDNFALMAIPFFMMAGELMGKGGISKRLVDFCNILVGRFHGGLGYVAVIASIIFAGLSGSAVADAAALGSILVPLMVVNGYKPGRSAGLISASSIIAPIIPPSVPMILLASAVGLSTTRLFMAGIIPGIIMGIFLMGAWLFAVKKDGYKDKHIFTHKEKIKITIDALPALVLPFLIIFGIRGGIFTPTEAGSFAVIYALVVSLFVYKEFTPKDLIQTIVSSARSSAIVMFIVSAASAAAWYITIGQIPQQMAQLLHGFLDKPILLLLVINGFFFLMGMIMDTTPNILIFAPVIFPVIKAAGIDPIYFGVIMVLNLCIGLITPPVGTVLYVSCGISKLNLIEVVKGVTPFLIVELFVLLLFVFIPQLITVPLQWLM